MLLPVVIPPTCLMAPIGSVPCGLLNPHRYELLKRVDRSMADKDQRDLCQQTEMSLWGKAKSLVRLERPCCLLLLVAASAGGC